MFGILSPSLPRARAGTHTHTEIIKISSPLLCWFLQERAKYVCACTSVLCMHAWTSAHAHSVLPGRAGSRLLHYACESIATSDLIPPFRTFTVSSDAPSKITTKRRFPARRASEPSSSSTFSPRGFRRFLAEAILEPNKRQPSSTLAFSPFE